MVRPSGRASAICLAVVASSVLGQGAGLYGLGALPNGQISYGVGVSADGMLVCGYGINGAGDVESLRWSLSEGTRGLGMPPGVGFSLAQQISSHGEYIAGYNQLRNGGRYWAYRWSENGGFEDLGDLAGGNQSNLSYAISDDGAVVVGLGNYASSVAEGFVWTEGEGMVGIGDLPGGRYHSQATGVSGDGRVVVGGSSNDIDWAAVRWTEADGLEAIGFLPGGTYSQAYDASFDGTHIVGVSSATVGAEGFRWSEGVGMIGLGDLPGGDHLSHAFAITSDGSVVVGRSATDVGDEAFIWDEDHGMRKLADVLRSDYGLDLSGWRLEQAHAISGDGTVIVGTGINPAGDTEGWVAVIPAPPAAALGLAAMAGIVGRPRHRGDRGALSSRSGPSERIRGRDSDQTK